MKKLVAFTALATTALMMFDVDFASATHAAGGLDDAASAAAKVAEDLAKAHGAGFKGIGGGLAAARCIGRRSRNWSNRW